MFYSDQNPIRRSLDFRAACTLGGLKVYRVNSFPPRSIVFREIETHVTHSRTGVLRSVCFCPRLQSATAQETHEVLEDIHVGASGRPLQSICSGLQSRDDADRRDDNPMMRTLGLIVQRLLTRPETSGSR